MSSPATPTGTRRRPNAQCGGENSSTLGAGGGVGWLGQLGGIVGDMLQGWGLLGALRGRGGTAGKTTAGWNSFGGVGSGLGSTGAGFGGLVGYSSSSPSSPMLNSRTCSPYQPGYGEHIELLPIGAQNPCYLRIEGLGKGGAGHCFGEATPLATPTWCDACAHLIFTAPVTCANCSYTCHEQCKALVAIDCRARLTPETDPHPDTKYVTKYQDARLTGQQPNAQQGDPALNPKNVVKPIVRDEIQESKELKDISNDSLLIGAEDDDIGTDLPTEIATTAPDVVNNFSEDEDSSSDYATLENDVPLTKVLLDGDTVTINDGLSTQELQQHVLQQHQQRQPDASKNNDRSRDTCGSGGGAGEEEKHEGEGQEKDQVTGSVAVSPDATSLRRAIVGMCQSGVAPAQLEAWLLDTAATQGLQLDKEQDGSYRGCLRIHLNLCRPINIVAGTRPPSIYDILQEDRTIDKTLTSFYMPRNAVKAIHITSKTTTREVIVALLRKFKVVDNPQKFALYERCYDESSTKGELRRVSDCECPLALAMAWAADGRTKHTIVLQENDTADIQWDAFSLPELSNFLRILEREERDYRYQIEDKYARIRGCLQNKLASEPA